MRMTRNYQHSQRPVAAARFEGDLISMIISPEFTDEFDNVTFCFIFAEFVYACSVHDVQGDGFGYP